MRWFALIVLLCLCIAHGGAVRVVEFCPDTYLEKDLDEYIVIEGQGSLDGVVISDGEGGFRFPAGSGINGRLVIARSAEAFRQVHSFSPDYEWYDYSREVPDVIRGGNLALANTYDELLLYEQDQCTQRIHWPDDVRTREGQIHYLEGGLWDRRPLFIGQSRFTPETFENVSVKVFVSPDSSYDVFVRAIDRADTEIHVNVYEFSSAGITESLTNAAGRGVNVTVLLEGGPVGGISAEERAAVFRLHVKGIPVFVMRTTEKGHAPYRYNHAKYIVVDGRGVLITSENFKESGIPQPGRSGNRGWGAYIENKGFARYMDAVFETDLHANFIAPFQGTEGPPEEVSDVSYTPEFPAREFSGTRVTPVLAPDTSSLILDLINGAEQDIAIEQAYITNESGTTLNPYLSAAINASRRGVHVRVLLDSYWFNVEEGADNDEMVRCINQIAAREHLPLTARLIDLPASSFAKIHNKGVIVDHQRVLVSSINWNSNSPGFNREAGVIIEHPGVAQYFGEVFDDDWNTQTEKGPGVDYPKIAAAIIVILLLLFIVYRKYRR